MKYYSQNGEDIVLWSLFKNKTNGFFLDIGALDGKVFSNTYSFEQTGWTGICVEAHPAYINILKNNRPRSHCIHAAVSDSNKKSVLFYSHVRGALSTLDKNMENIFSKRFKTFQGFKPIKVKMCTINRILKNFKFSKEIDLVSIDIEGSELSALRGFDLSKYKPRVLVIEALDKKREVMLDNYMKKNDYLLARIVSNNRFYCKTQQDKKILKRAQIQKNKLTLCKHPLDTGEVKL